jgi:hypothetical protein
MMRALEQCLTSDCIRIYARGADGGSVAPAPYPLGDSVVAGRLLLKC